MQALVLTGGLAPAIRGFASPESPPVLLPLPLEFGWDIAGYGAVSRFGKSVEGYYRFQVMEPQPNAWFEFPLTRIRGGL